MKHLIRDAVITLTGAIALAAGVCYAWPAHQTERFPIPGDSVEVKAKRVDVVDEMGNTKLTLYVEAGQARVDVRHAKGTKSVNLSDLVNRFGDFIPE
jgi:hypothetical protein